MAIAPRKTTPTRAPRPTASPKKATGRKAETATPPAAAPAPPLSKEAKPRKPKLVRDSFTMPKDEYAALGELKLRAAKLAQPAKKSELLRAGIKALTGMADAAFLSALKVVPAIKTGRPKKA